MRQRGIITAILTSENTRIVERRARKLKIDHVLQGISDKAEALKGLCSRLGVDLKDVVYVGDDLNDLEVFPMVGFSACPSDAMSAVRDAVRHVCEKQGGQGCIRELADWILR